MTDYRKGHSMAGKIVLTACSDARKGTDRDEIEKLKALLTGYGLKVYQSRYLYDDKAAGKEKASELSAFFSDKDITSVFDVSGGNVANELLPYLDYEAIADSPAVFWGYSDLTTIINAIYAKTGKASMLYQVRHLIENEDRQREFAAYMGLSEEFMEDCCVNSVDTHGDCCEKHNGVLDGCKGEQEDFGEKHGKIMDGCQEKSEDIVISSREKQFTNSGFHFLQGKEMSGILVGGNLRCFLKLAGTDYMPDLTGKVFLMEALGGDIYSARTMLACMEQLGVFRRINGLVVGTFTSLMRDGQYDEFLSLIKKCVPQDLPVVVTGDIGHGRDAKGILIGKEIRLNGK